MVRRKRRGRHWHHRVPDFKLVYCGPKKSAHRKEARQERESGLVEIIASTGEGVTNVSKPEKQR